MSVVLINGGFGVGGGSVGQCVKGGGVSGGAMVLFEVGESGREALTGTSDWDAFSRSVAVKISAGIWKRNNCTSL